MRIKIQLQIETLNICNAACVFCVYPQMERKKGIMDMDLYRKIIDEAWEIPVVDHITLNGLGEPLMDKLLIDRIKYARKKMAAIDIDFYTNGSFLTRDKAKELKEAGVSRLFVSLNATRSATRKDIMKVNDFDKVIVGLEALKEYGVKFSVLMTASKDLMEMDDIDRLKAMFPDGYMPHMENNWAGQLFMPRVRHHGTCERAIGQFMVLWDGRVSLCCMDGEGKVCFGDLNHQTIREVYNSEEYLRYRTFHMEGKRDQLKLCDVCTTG